jgi:hypothetical protein
VIVVFVRIVNAKFVVEVIQLLEVVFVEVLVLLPVVVFRICVVDLLVDELVGNSILSFVVDSSVIAVVLLVKADCMIVFVVEIILDFISSS